MIERLNILKGDLLITNSADQLVICDILFGLSDVHRKVKLIKAILRRLLSQMPVLSLDYGANCQGYSENVILAENQNLVPEDGAQVNLKAAGEEGLQPRKQNHLAGGVVLLQILMHEWRIVFQQLPKHLVCLIDVLHLRCIAIIQQWKLIEQVAKVNEALVGSSLVNEKHGCEVAHALDIADVWPEVLVGAQHIFQRLRVAVDLLE